VDWFYREKLDCLQRKSTA